MATIGERIKIQRTKLGMTLEEVAKIAGVTRQTVQKYENNIITNIPSDKIEAISTALEVSPAYLMGWTKDDESLTRKDERDISKDLTTIIAKLKFGEEKGFATFEGTEISEEDQELFAAQLEIMLRRLKKKNKEKYNPNKNKSEK